MIRKPAEMEPLNGATELRLRKSARRHVIVVICAHSLINFCRSTVAK